MGAQCLLTPFAVWICHWSPEERRVVAQQKDTTWSPGQASPTTAPSWVWLGVATFGTETAKPHGNIAKEVNAHGKLRLIRVVHSKRRSIVAQNAEKVSSSWNIIVSKQTVHWCFLHMGLHSYRWGVFLAYLVKIWHQNVLWKKGKLVMLWAMFLW